MIEIEISLQTKIEIYGNLEIRLELYHEIFYLKIRNEMKSWLSLSKQA